MAVLLLDKVKHEAQVEETLFSLVPLLEQLQQLVAVARLLLRHFFEDFAGRGITLRQIFGEGHVDARILLLGGNGDGENFALAEFGEGFQGMLRGNPRRAV